VQLQLMPIRTDTVWTSDAEEGYSRTCCQLLLAAAWWAGMLPSASIPSSFVGDNNY